MKTKITEFQNAIRIEFEPDTLYEQNMLLRYSINMKKEVPSVLFSFKQGNNSFCSIELKKKTPLNTKSLFINGK